MADSCEIKSQNSEFAAESDSLTVADAALGRYGDIPVAYAAVRAILNEDRTEVVDVEYLCVNRVYCEWGQYNPEDLIGHSYLGATYRASSVWLPFCYRAVVLREMVHEVVYSEEWGHWISFVAAPSQVEDCCVLTFVIDDEQHRTREELTIDRDTSDLIIEIMNAFSREQSYEVAMNSMLETLGRVVNPDRLLVFERGETMTRCIFEWHDEHVPPRIASIRPVTNEQFDKMNRLMTDESGVIDSEVESMMEVSEDLYERFKSSGVERMMAVALVHDGEEIGYLSANNYKLAEGLNVKRVLDTVAAFVAARMANQRLVKQLENASTHDSLTGLLNRRGIDAALEDRMSEGRDTPYALALVDVDDFKAINDMYGHDLGDVALSELAHSIEAFFPEGSVVGRNGGDEFLVVLFDEAASRADELLKAFAGSDLGCSHNGKWYPLSVSVGYAEYPGQASSIHDAYSKADAAVYVMKLSGKAGVARYSAETADQHRSQLGFTARSIADHIPGAMVVFRESGDRGILFANDEFVALLECESYADFMGFSGGSFNKIVHPDDFRLFESPSDRAVEAGDEAAVAGDEAEIRMVNFRLLTKSGGDKPVSSVKRVDSFDDETKATFMFLIEMDVVRKYEE